MKDDTFLYDWFMVMMEPENGWGSGEDLRDDYLLFKRALSSHGQYLVDAINEMMEERLRFEKAYKGQK